MVTVAELEGVTWVTGVEKSARLSRRSASCPLSAAIRHACSSGFSATDAARSMEVAAATRAEEVSIATAEASVTGDAVIASSVTLAFSMVA
jgi:hypothetical protein